MKRKIKTQGFITTVLLISMLVTTLLISCKKDGDPQDSLKRLENDLVQVHKFIIDGEEVIVEEKNNEFYYDHDIVLSREQMDLFKKWNGSMVRTDDRGAVLTKNHFTMLWPNKTLIYDPNFVDERNDSASLTNLKASVKEAMRRITEKTGVKFKERADEKAFVQFVNHPKDNNSMVGMIGSVQKINIAYSKSVGTIIHEIMHALGVFHEQARADRDEYLYNKGTSGNWGISGQMIGPFNVNSIMLYSVFLKPDSLNQYSPQFSDTLSKGDVLTVNFLYPKKIEGGKKYRMYSKKNAQWVLQGAADGLLSISKDNAAVAGQVWILEAATDSSYLVRSGIDNNLLLTAVDSINVKLLPLNACNMNSQQFFFRETPESRYRRLTAAKYPNRIVSANARSANQKGRDAINVFLDDEQNNEFQEFVLVEDN